MFCANCGKELPGGAGACPACGFSPGRSTGASTSSAIHEMVSEAKRAVKELNEAATSLSRQVRSGAQAAAKDPKGTSKRAVRRAAKELESAVDEIDRLIRKL